MTAAHKRWRAAEALCCDTSSAMACSSLMLERKWEWMCHWSRWAVVPIREDLFVNHHIVDNIRKRLYENKTNQINPFWTSKNKSEKSNAEQNDSQNRSPSGVVLRLDPCHPLVFVRRWAPCLSVCVFVCFWQPFFSQLLLCPWFFVVGMAGEQRGAFTPICHRLSSLAPVTRTHPHTRTHGKTGDLVTAILAFPKLPIAI